MECLDDVGGTCVGEDPRGDQGPGVVVEDVEDLHLGAVGEGPVGDVGLPALVGQVGLEAPPGATGPLLGLGDNLAPSAQHPPDRRHRRHHLVVAPMADKQVVVDGVGAGVEALASQGLAQGHDLVLHRR
jgi:hypothetical protein